MNVKRTLVLFIFLLASVSITYADSVDDAGASNDPAVNERANACYEGAEWEFKCETETDWAGGWYYIRLRAGIFSAADIPASYSWILPNVAPVWVGLPAGCYMPAVNGGYIFWPGGTGPSGTLPSYSDAACMNVQTGIWYSRVVARSQAEANMLCQTVAHSQYSIPGFGAQFWRC